MRNISYETWCSLQTVGRWTNQQIDGKTEALTLCGKLTGAGCTSLINNPSKNSKQKEKLQCNIMNVNVDIQQKLYPLNSDTWKKGDWSFVWKKTACGKWSLVKQR